MGRFQAVPKLSMASHSTVVMGATQHGISMSKTCPTILNGLVWNKFPHQRYGFVAVQCTFICECCICSQPRNNMECIAFKLKKKSGNCACPASLLVVQITGTDLTEKKYIELSSTVS